MPAAGLIGTVIMIVLYLRTPSFPTPDKIIVFVFFFFMIFRQALFVLKRLLPFVIILLVYDSFRGIADQLNTHVNYSFPAAFDRWIFGTLPTASLQNSLWQGQVRWYDFALYLPYLLHFILPLFLAVLIWHFKKIYYWRYVIAFSLVSFAAFFTFVLFPAAPPWLAAQNGYIEPIERISSDVWFSLGISDFPSLYNHISPNPVAAVPSLHAAWSVLVFIYVLKYFGRRWAILAALYPLIIIFGTVYQGEHYTFDALAGVVYALAAYAAAPYVVSFLNKKVQPLIVRHTHAKKQAIKRIEGQNSELK